MSKPTLGYWSIRDRGDSARMLLRHLGVDLEDKRWTLDDESPYSFPAQKSKLGMIVPNLPYWKDGDHVNNLINFDNVKIPNFFCCKQVQCSQIPPKLPVKTMANQP